ncbi:MAG: methyltransferase domain-containing protein [Phycisphaerales bacterium]
MNHAAPRNPSAADYVGKDIASLVPDKSNYGQSYMREGRMFSFAHQVEEVLTFEPKRVLEVGPGPGVVTHALRASGVEVLTLDIEPSLNPDILASVTQIPLPDNDVDVILCCQMLEHLPFEQFVPALRELRRVARAGGVVSLPDMSRAFFLDGHLPLLHSFAIERSLSRRPEPVSPLGAKDGHFWEIGVAGFKPRDVRAAIVESGWAIANEYRTRECRMHRFFVLKPAGTE